MPIINGKAVFWRSIVYWSTKKKELFVPFRLCLPYVNTTLKSPLFAEYEFHLHKTIDERFSNYTPKEIGYNFDYWYDLVNLYELEHNLPFRAGQLFCTERFVHFS
jgi:hypothetical protein